MIDYGIGSGGSVGILWMKSTDGNWYEVMVSGSNPSASVYVNQTPLSYQDASLGYQLLRGSNGSVYPVYLQGNSGSVNVVVSQSVWSNPYDYKPHFLMKSITDQKFYIVSVLVASGTSSLYVSQSSQMTLNW